jgi:hypothetical protein
VQIPVSVQVPVLQATTHRGTVTNYAWPSAQSDGATRAAVVAWTEAKRVCVWCREQAAAGAARATLAAEAQHAEEQARAHARWQAEERERQQVREQERRARHVELIAKRRREFGPEKQIKARIAGLRVIEGQRPPGFRRGPLERFFDALPLWLALVALCAPFAAGWYWGASMVDHPAEGGVPLLTPLPVALGIAATVLCFGPSVAAMAWQSFNDPRRTRKAERAREERRRLERQLGCGVSECDLCAAK